jgi:hypothetical protein
MGNKALKYGAVLIGAYLGIFYATKAGQLVTSSTNGGVKLVKAFQGR